MAISRGLFGMMAFTGDERKEYVPENYEGDDAGFARKSDEDGTTYEEDVLDGVGAPR